jgi:ribulose kinase
MYVLYAGLFDEKGKTIATASSPIQIWREGSFVEQSSTDIWLAICSAVKLVCKLASIDGTHVSGIGFTATCSLGK